ncbi:hypothetical protein LCGC14_1403810 [marine sediment metagenome]|uniref:Uncharacterized protein n=1 Tax=marine sediment metagenome TaxID=412755 RepID=A0A0F9KH71_9ZZZZ
MNKIKKCRYLFLLITILIPLLFLNSNLFYHSIKKNISDLNENNNESFKDNVRISQGVSTLFEGTEQNLNITDTGMSNEGFMANLNVTKKMDTVRKKVRVDNIQNLKGGKKRR